MKYREILFIAAAAALAASSAAADPTVKVTVVGLKANQGFMMIALHSEQAWSGAAVAKIKVAVTAAAMTVTLAAPAPGRYGIKMFHDVNGDGEMATNIVGFPTEPFGFSNDAPVRFGPPSFADAGFDIGPNGAAQTITLR
ncbi:MAG: DUF2141 domain-containing protein [Alphaproteobacteria bacterium]|nr:DUF2141 domain-containing protein [Alphaproteobacteria bacterium]